MKTRDILIVDDHLSTLELFRWCLESAGLDTVCATDGSKALEMLENREFKMVITDLNMPVISGLELAAKVRLQHAEIPVVLVTATEPAAIVAEAEEAGISCIISKPVNMRKFLTTIRSLLDHRSMQGNQEMECQP